MKRFDHDRRNPRKWVNLLLVFSWVMLHGQGGHCFEAG